MSFLNTYIGQKGYTLLKSELNPQQQHLIKKELMIKPYTAGAPSGSSEQIIFPAFRESNSKYYVPRYFGEKHFGIPTSESKISEGTNININFVGELRDYQKPVVQKYLDYVLTNNGKGGLLELPCAFGKCLGKDTEILMYDGTIKKVQDIQINDLLMGDDSTPRMVLSLARGREQMYKVSSKKGDSYICNESHILSLKCSTNHSKLLQKGTIIDMSVLEFLNLPKSFHGKGGSLLGYKVPINFEEKYLEFDPYMIGYWLGDGCSSRPIISTQEACVIKYFVDYFKYKHTDLYLRYTGGQYDYRINSLKKQNSFMCFLRKYNLINNKHIPYYYKCNSKKNRLELLAGLIDSDGYFYKGSYEIVQKNEKLLDDIVFLARSLGFACYKKRVIKTCTNAPGGPKKGVYYLTKIYGSGLEEIPVLCNRKQGYIRKQIKNALSYRLTIEKLEIDEYYGFEIDGNRRFVLADFSVTHNTALSINIISALKKKTLVIVHKEFLMNQWIERIQQFLPNAKVGKIQGQIIDIEDKDIVIGMLQSLSMKEYPSSTFDSFGLTIIDEVHHISSQTFSNALFKIVTKYMLGLSATMNRKDGTTEVFKMFLGDIIYKAEQKKNTSVEVRAISYKTTDDEFNHTIMDYRGQPQISSMISKLCSYNNRTEFVIKILNDFIRVEGIDKKVIDEHKLQMDLANPCCATCNKSNNYLMKNTCCQIVKYCMICLDNVVKDAQIPVIQIDKKTGEEKTVKRRPKCPNCTKVLSFEQYYIENPYIKPLSETHTIIMSHNLNILEYMYKKMICKNYASVGYYIGGMDETSLKKSETKQVILSSYQMASEGLDISTLNAEFLISPKTDIEQCVGRILRAKHATNTPIIYDFIDSHDIFKRQWLKRKAFYKKQNYKIVEPCNLDITKWKIIFDPNKCIKEKNEEDIEMTGNCLLIKKK
jgi:superfamily II DNA or RNA helicase